MSSREVQYSTAQYSTNKLHEDSRGTETLPKISTILFNTFDVRGLGIVSFMSEKYKKKQINHMVTVNFTMLCVITELV